jgi:hypothetical protein
MLTTATAAPNIKQGRARALCAAAGLVVMHAAVGAAVIPALAHTARAR